MDEKIVWPLVGVALGWALSLFSTVLKDRAEQRQKIGALVSKLLHIHSQLLTLQQVTEFFKDNAENWEEYEPIRKRLTLRHFLEPESHVESLRNTIDEVSGLYPVEARSLHNLVDMLLKNKSTSLQAFSEGRDLYIRMLSVHEFTLYGAEKMLRESVRRYARRHGVFTYGAVLLELRRRKDATYKMNVEFAEQFLAEMLDAIRNPERAPSSAQPSPASEAP